MSATHLTDVIHLPRRQPCETSGCTDPKCLGLTPDRRLTLAVIARNANREGVTWGVGVAGTAERRGITRQSAGRQLAWLTEHGLIRPDERQSRDGTTPYLLTYSTPERRTRFDVRGWWFDHLLTLELKAGDIVALLACAVYANKETLVFTPSLATLARLTGEADRDLRRRLSRLVDAGLLGREVQAHAGRLGRTPEHRRVNVWTLKALVGVEQPVVVISRPSGEATLIPPGSNAGPPGEETLIPPRSLKGSPLSENSGHLRQQQPKPEAKPQPQPAKVVDLTDLASQKRMDVTRQFVAILSRDGYSDGRGAEWAALFASIDLTLVARILAADAPGLRPEIVAAADKGLEVFRFAKLTNPGGFATARLRQLCALAAKPDFTAVDRERKNHRDDLNAEFDRQLMRLNGKLGLIYRDLTAGGATPEELEARMVEARAKRDEAAMRLHGRWRQASQDIDADWMRKRVELVVARQVEPAESADELFDRKWQRYKEQDDAGWDAGAIRFRELLAAERTPQAVAA